jgi:large subunit ribosomal protein L25
MTDRQLITFESRSVTGKKVSRLRREGILPATIYGKGVGPFSVQINARAFNDIYRRVGRTTLIDLQVPGQKIQSGFIHALQRHPVTRSIIHVDIHVVDLLVELTVSIPIHFVGESELVARGDAVLNQALAALDVHALPTDLPSAIEVDISGLDGFDKTIQVRDITLPGKGTIVTPEDEVVASLSPARAEEEPTEEVEEVSAEPELVREKRDEEEE